MPPYAVVNKIVSADVITSITETALTTSDGSTYSISNFSPDALRRISPGDYYVLGSRHNSGLVSKAVFENSHYRIP